MSLLAAAQARLRRAARMPRSELLARIRDKMTHNLGYRANLRRLAFRLERHSRRFYDAPYRERSEAGPINLEVKLERQRQGGPFEPYNIALLNRAAASLLQPRHRRILEIGSGTGMFASLAAADQDRRIVASESNAGARAWAIEHRSASNIEYCDLDLRSVRDDGFDLVVAIEVIEHIADFASFLRLLGRAAPEAIITTPNKGANAFSSVARTPAYSEHVREWNAGEFYWVLRAFYGEVELFTVPEQARQIAAMQRQPDFIPQVAPASELCSEALMIALCRQPLR